MKAIEVKNLSFFYQSNSPLIENLSFSVDKGEFVLIMGTNGSGKSTIAKLLTGILKPTAGEIIINGVKQTNDKYINPISIVFQNPDNQFVASTVEEDIAFGLENKCVPYEEMQSRVVEFAKKVHMEDYLDFEPSKLSGGQKQRVAIAGVLVLENNILILDEATSMLDTIARREVVALINELREANKDLTVLSISHDRSHMSLATKIMVIEKGSLKSYGTIEEMSDLFEGDFSEFMPDNLRLKKVLNNAGIAVKNAKLDDIVEELCPSK